MTNPVGITDIARLADVKPDTVHHWRIRHADFPAPRWTIGGRPAWEWRDIEAWIAARKRP